MPDVRGAGPASAAAPWRRIYVDLPWAEGAVDTGAATPRDVADAVLAEVAEITNGGQFEMDHAKRRLPPREVIVIDEAILERGGDWRDSFAEMAVVHIAETLDGAGHNLHLERPHIVGELVRDWLERIPRE